MFDDIEGIIRDADSQTGSLIITRAEREALQDTVSEHTPALTPITADSFLHELREQEDLFRQRNGFVGITRFIRNHLVSKGYDHFSAFRVLQELNNNGTLEVYHVPNPNSDYETAAVRSVDNPDDSEVQPE